MKTKVCRALALLLCLICLCSAASAQVAGISIIGVRHAEDKPQLYLGIRTMSGNGAAVASNSDNVTVFGGREQVPLSIRSLKGAELGHIVVVDTSLYYYGSEYIKDEDVRNIILGYLDNIPKDERVMFVSAAELEPVLSNYMTVEEAQEHVQNIELGDFSPSCIYKAICTAFEMAANPKSGAPAFNNVYIVADPDQVSNVGSASSLGEAAMIYNHSGFSFDVVLAVPYRETYMKGSSGKRRQELETSFGNYANFCQQVNGRYVQVPQNNEGVDVAPLAKAMNAIYGTGLYFVVDCTPMRNYVPVDGAMQPAALSVYYKDQSDQAVRTVEVQLNTALLPEPDPTPTPEPEATPTPVPKPTPVVAMGQTDPKAMQAILALYEMNYLTDKNHDEFDNECFVAYIEFCRTNNLDASDGVYEDAYEKLLTRSAIPATTPTPTPGPTPEPTIPPEGYAINDADPENGIPYIAQLQSVLKKLNCYEADVTANVGRMDQATVDAVARYCEAYNWRNDHPNGVTKLVCQEIITNGPNMEPLEPKQPSLREKIIAFLNRELKVGSLTLKMWIPVAVCVALLFVIVVLIVVLSGRGKNKPAPMDDPTPSPSFQPLTTSDSGSAAVPYTPAPMPVMQAEDVEETMQPYFSKLITLTVQYGGRTRTEEAELKENPPYTIGRKDCQLLLDGADSSASRKQAELYIKDNQVYVRDKSSYQNTYVNGRKVRTGTDGTVVNNGDRLQLSEHTVTIRW